jgi:uncharacterized protein YbjT (DUF2867 family)
MRPIASKDAASFLASLATSEPKNAVVEVAGPKIIKMDDFARRALRAQNSSDNTVVTDPDAPYFGGKVDDESLVPGSGALFGKLNFEDWLRQA